MDNQKTENILKSIAGGGLIIFVGSIIGKILRFILFICLIRVLGATLFGLYSIGLSIIDSIANIALLGDGRGLIRFAAGFLHDDDKPRLKGMIIGYIIICLSLSFVIALLFFLSANFLSYRVFHNSALLGVLKIFALSFPFYIFALVVIPIGFAFQKMEYKVIIQEISQPIISIIVIVLTFNFLGRMHSVMAGFFVSSLVTAILGFYLLKKIYLQVLSNSKCIFDAKEIIIYSLPLLGIIFCYYFLFRLDRIILGIYRTPFEVGIYSAASNTVIGAVALSNIFEACFAPVIAQLCHSNRKEELIKIYNCITSWGMAAAFIPSIALIIFNKEIVLLFGKDFTSVRLVLIILAISCLIEIIPGKLRQLFQMSSHQNLELINSILMIIFNLIFNLIFISLLGVIGAALAFLFTVIFITVIRTIELKIIFNFHPFNARYLKFLSFIIFTIIVSFLIGIYAHINLKVFSGVFIFMFFIWIIFKFKSNNDIILWNTIKLGIGKSKILNGGF